MLSAEESDTLLSAQSGAMAACARKNGLSWTGWNISDGDYSYVNMWREFGPWTEFMASNFGFAQPRSDLGLMTTGLKPKSEDYEEPTVPNTELSESEIGQVTETCNDDPVVMSFMETNVVDYGPWAEDLGGSADLLEGNDSANEVFDELAVCFEQQGMTMKEDSPGFPTAATVEVIDEEQIQLALKVVDCQTSVNATERLTDIMADL
ncbi:hypothetical protein [Ancrocorticia sp.]